jgi:ribosome-associated translation inhibitor RaiA
VQSLAIPTGPAFTDPDSAIAFPYEISFKNTEPSEAARFQIAQYLAKLSQLSDRITDCKVVVSIPHKRSGNRYFHIHAALDLPGKRIAVSRDPEFKDAHAEIQVAISSCFHKLTRQMEDYLRTRG